MRTVVKTLVFLVDKRYRVPLVEDSSKKAVPTSFQGLPFALLAQRPRPKACSHFLTPSFSHPQRRQWLTGPQGLILQALVSALTLHSPCFMDSGTKVWHWVQGTWGKEREAWFIFLWHLLTSFKVFPLLSQPPYVQLSLPHSFHKFIVSTSSFSLLGMTSEFRHSFIASLILILSTYSAPIS